MKDNIPSLHEDYLICPHCDNQNKVPDDCYSENTIYECKCSECNKIFGFTISYLPSYSETILPCSNGKECNWIKSTIFPKPIKYDEYRCKYCQDIKTIEIPLKEKIKRYNEYWDLNYTVKDYFSYLKKRKKGKEIPSDISGMIDFLDK